MKTTRQELTSLLCDQSFAPELDPEQLSPVYSYAEGIARVERCTVVVSDLKHGASRIFHGRFSQRLGLSDRVGENSIWEREILCHLSNEECERKYLAELRFYNFLRRLPRHRRPDYYLASHLLMTDCQGVAIDVLHRMYYCYEPDSDAVRFAVCIYGPSISDVQAKSAAIDAVTGTWIELSSGEDNLILSSGEKEVLALIATGLTSADVATRLCISHNTVNRHRQSILAKLQAKNSTEACRRAKQLKII